MPIRLTLSELPTSTWLQYVCIASLAVIGVRQAQLWYRLRHIPGPRSAGWSLWWQLSGALSGKYHEHLKAATDEYGKCIHSLFASQKKKKQYGLTDICRTTRSNRPNPTAMRRPRSTQNDVCRSQRIHEGSFLWQRPRCSGCR